MYLNPTANSDLNYRMLKFQGDMSFAYFPHDACSKKIGFVKILCLENSFLAEMFWAYFRWWVYFLTNVEAAVKHIAHISLQSTHFLHRPPEMTCMWVHVPGKNIIWQAHLTNSLQMCFHSENWFQNMINIEAAFHTWKGFKMYHAAM